MADLLDSIRSDLQARLDELRPLVREYERLEEAEKALGDGRHEARPRAERGAETGRQRRRRGRASTRARRPSTPAAREANRGAILSLIDERPGITKAELKQATGLSGAGVAQNLRRLVDRGEVREEALPGGEAGYRTGGGDRGESAGVESGAAETAAAGERQAARRAKSRRRTPAGTRPPKAATKSGDAEPSAAAKAADSEARDGGRESSGSDKREEPAGQA